MAREYLSQVDMPISLSDDELRIVMDCAQPLQPHERARFLQDVAAELDRYRSDIGPGMVSRVAAEAQRRHFDPAQFFRLQRGTFGRNEQIFDLRSYVQFGLNRLN